MTVNLELDNELLAAQYERISLERQFVAGQRLLREVELLPGERVLDIGAGTGLLAEYAAGIVGAAGQVVGIDPLPLRIEIAQRKARSNLTFRVANAYDLSEFPDDSFNVAYMNAVFHWLPSKHEPLRQIVRILKRRGRLAISSGARGSPNPVHRIRESVLSRPPYNQYAAALEPVVYRVSADELDSLLRNAGFEVSKLLELSSVRQRVSPEEAMQFSEASSFGNLLGHLPAELRDQARREIKHELEREAQENPAPRMRVQLVAVATKP